jgi:hypothetical protein
VRGRRHPCPRRSNVTSRENAAGVRRNRATPGSSAPRHGRHRPDTHVARLLRQWKEERRRQPRPAHSPARRPPPSAGSSLEPCLPGAGRTTATISTGSARQARSHPVGSLGHQCLAEAVPVVGGEDDEATGSRRAVPQAVQLPGRDRGHKGSPSRRSAHEGRVVKAEAVEHHRLGVRLSCRRDGSPGYFRSSSCSSPRRPGSPRRAPRRLA